MATLDEIKEILRKIAEKTATGQDFELLRQVNESEERITIQSGKQIINLGQGIGNHFGDRIYYVKYELSDDAIKALIQELRPAKSEDIVGMVLNPPMPSNYNEQTFVGREAVISDILPKLQGQTRLLWITGISGIGKTALGECLASQSWERDPSFQWIYLEILEGQSPDFASVAAELLAKLGDREIDPQERNNPEQLAKRLLQKLQSHPYWIQMDSLERLLNPAQPTEFVDAYWATFLQRCLTESDVVSRLVLTAQAFPTALVEFSDRYPNFWAELRLDGLLQIEQQLEFFTKRRVIVEPSNRDILTRIAQIYEGHPLVLKVITEDILKSFAGDVNRYWQVYQSEFEQVARELQATRLDETEYNEALDRKVRERIKRSLEQLPGDALDLLCRSAVFRRPVPKKFWLAMIGDCSPQQQKVAYRVLGDRALIEKESTDIRQHNLIRSVAYDLLTADIPTWHEAERQAAHIWLTAYEPATNAPNLETVRGYLEAFNHYCVVEKWEAAADLPYTKLKTNTTLQWQLLVWGYFQEIVLLNSNLLIVTQKLNDRQGEGKALTWLGIVFARIGQYERAIEYYQQSLPIAHEIGDRQGECAALGNLGLAYDSLMQYERAIECHQQSLTISQEMGDLRRQGNALGSLGLVFNSLGQYAQALDYYQQSLTIAREIGDLHSEGAALVNMGNTLLKLDQYQNALTNNQSALAIFREIGAQAGEAEALKNLAELHQALGEVEVARQYCQQALALATELGIPLKAECEALLF